MGFDSDGVSGCTRQVLKGVERSLAKLGCADLLARALRGLYTI